MDKQTTWTIIFVGLLFVAFPKIMLGTEYGIIVDGKLTSTGQLLAGQPEQATGKTTRRLS